MYNIHKSPQNKYRRSSGSASFIRDISPSRFRNTIKPGDFSQPLPISRLRHSFSAGTINFLDQFQYSSYERKQEKKKTYQSLKHTLNQLQNRIWRVNSSLKDHNFTNKKMQQQQNKQQENQEKGDKNRQTISTQTKNFYFNNQRISKLITSQPKPINYNPCLANPYDTKKYNSYYISQAIRAVNQKNSLAIQHINGSIKMIQYCIQYIDGSYSPQSRVGFEMKRLPKDMNKKKTLVLDLDQTLIHCYENLEIVTDITLTMNIQGQKVKIGVNIRPYAMTFLKKMAKQFEIVIFTASHQTYANAILDELDPQKQIFSHRFYRAHCVVLPNELHVKDLRYLKRDLKDVLLVDNAAYSYAFQLDNGIPILPFYEGKDFQLSVLEKYLEKVVDVDDVRIVNKQYFKLAQYSEFQTAEQLVRKLYFSQLQ